LISRPSPLFTSTTPRLFSTSPDNDQKLTGAVRYFENAKSYGFIKSPNHEDQIFVHESSIVKPDIPDEKFQVFPRRGTKVSFKLNTKPDGLMEATEVTNEDGSMIQPFQKNYMDSYTKNRKGRFGMEVYDIMDSVTEQSEMETRIVEAFEGVKSDVANQKAKVEKILSYYEDAAVGDEN
jgi:cold shock CspA family protein